MPLNLPPHLAHGRAEVGACGQRPCWVGLASWAFVWPFVVLAFLKSVCLCVCLCVCVSVPVCLCVSSLKLSVNIHGYRCSL